VCEVVDLSFDGACAAFEKIVGEGDAEEHHEEESENNGVIFPHDAVVLFVRGGAREGSIRVEGVR